jgi:hypothetical protein
MAASFAPPETRNRRWLVPAIGRGLALALIALPMLVGGKAPASNVPSSTIAWPKHVFPVEGHAPGREQALAGLFVPSVSVRKTPRAADADALPGDTSPQRRF